MDEPTPTFTTDEIEAMMLYRELGVTDSEMDLILELAFIATMSTDGDCCQRLADAIEVLHPHHAGAFIVRGLRYQAAGNLLEAARMFVTGTQSDLKAKEAATLCMNMLEMYGLDHLELADAIRPLADPDRAALKGKMPALFPVVANDDTNVA